MRGICLIGLSSCQRKTTDDWHATGAKSNRPGQCHAVTVALEITTDTNALRMIAAKTGMHSVHLLKRIDHHLW